MSSPSDSLPKKIWEITVQVENGDWHWTRTKEEVTFDEAVDQAVFFKSNFEYGRLISLQDVSSPRLPPIGTSCHHHEDPLGP